MAGVGIETGGMLYGYGQGAGLFLVDLGGTGRLPEDQSCR